MKRTLTLKAEHLAELGTDDLAAVVGGVDSSVPDTRMTILPVTCITHTTTR
jgi:hypothetical protein